MDKIFVITTNIAPYRLRWCEELSNYFNVSIVYSKQHDFERDDRWLKKESDKCQLIKLKNNNNIYDPLCFDVIDIIKNNPGSLFIFDGYGPKTNLLGLLYCKLHKIETYVNVDGYPTERNKSSLKEAIKRYVISKLCTNFTCGGENVKQHLIEYGADPEKIIVHNFSSIKDDEILTKPNTLRRKNKIREELGLVKDKKIVLTAGRFLPLKRFEDLIKAVLKCQSDCELYLLGGRPTQDYLRLSIGHKNIHFIDFVLPEQVGKYYEACDLFVLPSETDVWGLVLNEAMAKGLPVIASDSVVAGENLIDGNGKIFETYNVDELSKDIDYCLKDKINKQMAKRSLEIIKDYTIENMARRQLIAFNTYFVKAKK